MPKDACYYKVKRQYKVFPSAYASGAIAKCRKNKGKKKNRNQQTISSQTMENISKIIILSDRD